MEEVTYVEEPTSPSKDAWTPPLPFSQRDRLREAQDWVAPPPAQVVEDDIHRVNTAEIPQIPSFEPTDSYESGFPDSPPAHARGGFRLLSPDELTPEEFRQLCLQMTAFWYAQQLHRAESIANPPAPYYERFYVWKMIFQELIVVAALALLTLIATVFFSTAEMPRESETTRLVVMGGLFLVGLWFAVRTYWAWANTHVYSDLQETGIKRPLNRWLLLTEMNRTLETTSLVKKDADRRTFTSFFNLNSWRVTLDSPAQEDKFLHNRAFIRDGDRLKKTVTEVQNFLGQAKR